MRCTSSPRPRVAYSASSYTSLLSRFALLRRAIGVPHQVHRAFILVILAPYTHAVRSWIGAILSNPAIPHIHISLASIGAYAPVFADRAFPVLRSSRIPAACGLLVPDRARGERGAAHYTTNPLPYTVHVPGDRPPTLCTCSIATSSLHSRLRACTSTPGDMPTTTCSKAS